MAPPSLILEVLQPIEEIARAAQRGAYKFKCDSADKWLSEVVVRHQVGNQENSKFYFSTHIFLGLFACFYSQPLGSNKCPYSRNNTPSSHVGNAFSSNRPSPLYV